MDNKLNVLLLGNSGVGKSTLINAVLAKELAASGAGRSVTSRIAVYETEEIPCPENMRGSPFREFKPI